MTAEQAKPERGKYRSITVVLLDGPDFQALPPEERWVFVCLKVGLGPGGIEVEYPEALAVKLAARTGFPTATVTRAMDTLEAGGWIRRERNVVWVVGQLRYEPAMTDKNSRHRAAVLAHVQGLPRLAIVAAFIREYKDYLPDWDRLLIGYPEPEDSLPIPYPGPGDSLPNHRDRDRERNRDRDSAPKAARARRVDDGGTPTPAGPIAQACELWQASRGNPNGGRIGKTLKALLAKHGARQALAVWAGYLEFRRDNDFCTVEDFRDNYEFYRRKWGVEIGEDGSEVPIPDEPGLAA